MSKKFYSADHISDTNHKFDNSFEVGAFREGQFNVSYLSHSTFILQMKKL